LGIEVGRIIVLMMVKIGLTIAGIGGGGVVVAIGMAWFGLTTKPAIAISSFATLVATLGSFFFNFRLRHPEKP
jgi:hypothetical protein